MEVTSYARILRRRWKLVLLPCVVALLAAWWTLPEEAAPADAAVTSYSATATLITPLNAPVDEVPISLATVALYATTGDIPDLAAAELKYDGLPEVLAAQVLVQPNAETSTLTFTTTDEDGQAAANRVNVFADTTIQYFKDLEESQNKIRAREINRELDRIGEQITALEAGGTNALEQTEMASLNEQYSLLQNELRTVTGNSSGPILEVLQSGVPIPEATQTFAAPTNPMARIGIAALLGLLLGAALALIVERLDSRMRTREQVEDAVGLPVLAEIPTMPKNHRDGVASAARPASTVAEAFRNLRSSVLLLSPGLADAATKGAKPGGLTILVTSALPHEGKTTTVANLAAVMAEAGRRVLVLSLDLRNPRVHQVFGVENGTGVSDLLAADRGRQLKSVLRETGIAGVTIATSGHQTDHPGALLASVGPMIEAARSLADVVLIDTPPMLAVSDALDVARHADVTLLVSRLNKTTRGQAEECHRLLSRLGIAALGTVLVGTRPAGARYGYPMASPPEATVAEKSEQTEQTDRTEQTDKAEKTEKNGKTAKTERADSGAGEAD
ncbi:polysaccharide biosynthesis tyrosine autokinase [Nocardioides euryhalodurans]|uniref:Tyrosine-protein kinase family protein n=1 Tax=Nocardioides euryhalodurans TaxID=2518370 RepID=A0A4P7GHH3_9ACTN|nr:CpsD/CapB family tyrosine-protein kinase [Nocardioides euryhalodurans]QBR91191.1 tyrosine-protein kinase family protein [Nocardioides euryhalodurans]